MKKGRVKTIALLALIVLVLFLLFSKQGRDTISRAFPSGGVNLDLGGTLAPNEYVIPSFSVPILNGVTVPPVSLFDDPDKNCCCGGGSGDDYLPSFGMSQILQAPRLPAYVPPPPSPAYYQAPAINELITYETDNLSGRQAVWKRDNPALRTNSLTGNFDWNDRVRSLKVVRGRWRVYEHANYQGRSASLGPGNYNSLSLIARGLYRNISSMREEY